MTPDNLDQLILQTLSGDMDALEALYHEMEGSVYALALSILRNTAAAQDITQDTFVRLCTTSASYKPRGTGKAWILTITRNLALRTFHEKSRYADIDQLPESIFFDHRNSESDQQNRLLLKMALAKLGEDDRQIVLLHVSGLKHNEIADVLKRPAATIRWKYAQAIKRLSQWMNQETVKEGTPHEN